MFWPSKLNEVAMQFLFAPAQIGLGMFFFISGYLILKSLDSMDESRFLVRRFFRIFPVYWFIGVIAICIYYKTGYIRHLNHEINYCDILVYFSFVKDFIWYDGLEYLTSSNWTLYIEVYFYIITYYCFKYSNFSVSKFFKCFYASVIFLFLFMWLGGFSTKMYGKTAAVIFFISLGLLFYIRERDGMKNFWRYVSIICLFGVLFFCKFEKLRLSNQDFVCAFSYIIGFLISYFVITYGQNLKYNKYVNFFANISYPVFLFHQTFGTIGQGGGHTFGFFYTKGYTDIRFQLIDRAIFFACITIPVCYLIHKYIEKPFINLSKKI